MGEIKFPFPGQDDEEEEDSVAEVTIDEIIEEEPPPPPETRDRPRRAKAALSPGKKKKAPEIHGEGLAAVIRRKLRNIYDWVMYSGAVNRNSPIIVTVRLLLVVAPIMFAIVMSYVAASAVFPRYTSVVGSGMLPGLPGQTTLSTGVLDVPLALPDGFQPVPLDDYFRDVPLARAAATADGFIVALTALAASGDDEGSFVSVSLASEAGKNISQKEFKVMKKKFVTSKDLQSSVQMSVNRVLAPRDETENSVCFGRMAGTKATDTPPDQIFYQESCLLWYNRRALVINSGYSTHVSEEPDRNRVRAVLMSWRDALLAAK